MCSIGMLVLIYSQSPGLSIMTKKFKSKKEIVRLKNMSPNMWQVVDKEDIHRVEYPVEYSKTI